VQEEGLQAHPQKFCFVKKPGKIPKILAKDPENLGKFPEILGKIYEKSEHKWRPTLFALKNGTQRLQKNTGKPFFGGHIKKVFMILCEKFCRQNSHKNVSGKFEQKSFEPPKICLFLHQRRI